jgi:Tfp pilus assembly protein PilN
MLPQVLKLSSPGGNKRHKPILAISIQQHLIEGIVIDPNTQHILNSHTIALSSNIFTNGTDQLKPTHTLKIAFKDLMTELQVKTGTHVVLSVPCTTTKIIELPKMEEDEYHQALTAEIERYRAFENTDVIVSFTPVEGSRVASQQLLLATACRRDTLQEYLRCLKELRLKVIGLYTHPYSIFTSFLEGSLFKAIEQQAETRNFCWGSLMQDGDRFRIFLWKGRQLRDVREITLSGQLFQNVKADDLILQDTYKEIKRSLHQLNDETPTFWVSHQLNWNSCNYFSEKLEAPIQPFEVDLNLYNYSKEVNPNLIGAYLCVQEPLYHYGMNLITKFNNLQAESQSFSINNTIQIDIGDEETFIKKQAKLLLINLLLLGGSYLFFSISNLQNKKILASFQHENVNNLHDLAQLSIELGSTKKSLQFYESFKAVQLQDVQRIHQVSSFLEELGKILPPSCWIEVLQLDKTLELSGYTLTYQDMLQLNERIKQLKSLSSPLGLKQIEENWSKDHKKLFKFKLEGNSLFAERGSFLSPASGEEKSKEGYPKATPTVKIQNSETKPTFEGIVVSDSLEE